MLKKLFWSLCIGVLLTGGVFAVGAPPVSNGGLLPGPTSEFLKTNDEGMKAGQTYISQKLIPTLVSGFLVIMLMIGVIMLIIAGINYILCAGDSEKVKQAKDIIFWSLLAIIFAVMGFVIVKFVIGIDISGPPL
jgi:hypothetical protein